ncbi:hypothetical protein DFH27DRAFT_521791 [Peziza echinospora]|nr:hypothetical protein DFH27DRAFT_521791 [Peziza echinospora]
MYAAPALQAHARGHLRGRSAARLAWPHQAPAAPTAAETAAARSNSLSSLRRFVLRCQICGSWPVAICWSSRSVPCACRDLSQKYVDRLIGAKFTHIIDAFLRSSDLKTVSLRNVRAHLQNVLGYDLTPVKDEIRLLIQERFNEILAEEEKPIKPEVKYERPETDEALSELESSPPSSPKATKPSRKHNLEDDKKLAARLHKELNAGRPSRQAAAPQKKKAAPKKKAVKKSKAEVDSDSADEDGQPKKKRAVNRNNPFNALMQLSEPLSDLIGRSECSRPETVKAIWDYVKKNNLQDENDKRYIVCDDSLKRVFDNAERVHMFTMNKLLSAHISPLPKTEETPSA